MKAILFAITLVVVVASCATSNKSPVSARGHRLDLREAIEATGDRCLAHTYVDLSVGAVRGDILEMKARQFLEKRFSDFHLVSNSLTPIMEVNARSEERCVYFLYRKGSFGEPYWAVTFNYDGRITHHETGVTTEGFSH